MTLQQLQTAAEKLGVKYELNPRFLKTDYYNFETNEYEKVQYGWFFGINNLSGRDEWSWTWFETIGDDTDKFYFSERYSMRTGRSNTGWRERYKANERICKLNEIEYQW